MIYHFLLGNMEGEATSTAGCINHDCWCPNFERGLLHTGSIRNGGMKKDRFVFVGMETGGSCGNETSGLGFRTDRF